MRVLLAFLALLWCAEACQAQVNKVEERGDWWVITKTVDPLMWDNFNLRFRPAFLSLNDSLPNKGNPNLAFPWTVGGGMHNVPGHAVYTVLGIPKGSWINVTHKGEQEFHRHTYADRLGFRHLYHEVEQKPQSRWVYPAGTRVAALHSSRSERFIDRIREFDGSEWHDDEKHVGRVPREFVDNNDCMNCHQQAGRQATTLPRYLDGDYRYNSMRGDHTVFGFSWLDQNGNIPWEYRHFVRFVDGKDSGPVTVSLEMAPAPSVAQPPIPSAAPRKVPSTRTEPAWRPSQIIRTQQPQAQWSPLQTMQQWSPMRTFSGGAACAS